jgi:glycosyltransferase involved in cell wall biosynthesis
MRILLVTKKVPFPPHDGEAIALRNMLDLYLAMGWKVDMLCMQTPKHPYTLSEAEKARYADVHFQVTPVTTTSTIPGALWNLLGQLPYHIVRFYSHQFENDLLHLMRQNTYQIIQLEGLHLAAYLPAIRQQHNEATVIYRSHNVEGHIWQRLAEQEKRVLKKWYIRLQSRRLLEYELRIIESFDRILAISVADAATYSAYVPVHRVAVLPTGFHFPETPSSAPIPASFYFIGALDWMPNLSGLQRFLKNVWPVVYQKRSDAVLHIAGRNSPANFADNLPPGVVFHGEVSDAATFISDKAVCIVPLWAGSGLKIKIVEALVAGKPLITTPVGVEGLPESLENLCGVAETNEGLQQLLLKYLSSWPKPLDIAHAAADEVRRTLSHEAVLEQLKSIMHKWDLA